MRTRLLLPGLAAAALAGGLAAAQERLTEAEALVLAKRQADEATERSRRLERQAAAATSEAAKARAAASALIARIEAAEADITAAEARIRIIDALRVQQRARLAERQGPVVRLTAALQTMARRPPALALVQPGSVHDVVHVRSLLASTLPVIRARTASLREEIKAGNRLREQAETARASLLEGQEELRKQRLALARLEERERARSRSLASSALSESDRALAFSEEARDLSALMGTRQYQARIRSSLAELPGPVLRPGTAPEPERAAPRRYILPVDGRLVTGTGEISDAGVHARGLTFETDGSTEVIAPRAGRVVYAGDFRSYGRIVILDHGGGWTTLITNLEDIAVPVGRTVPMGARLGRTPRRSSKVTVELRRGGRPVPIAPLLLG
ncbi:MAG: peptidoglycan DD-metalloendopeptidase family protein [Pseudomonadota bacterium]|nr:peptidoglycan DD-metalloendopeptidase family protein [Pseudomonadota bacterium]